MYRKIKDPVTGIWFNTNSEQGINVINNYKKYSNNMIGGFYNDKLINIIQKKNEIDKLFKSFGCICSFEKPLDISYTTLYICDITDNSNKLDERDLVIKNINKLLSLPEYHQNINNDIDDIDNIDDVQEKENLEIPKITQKEILDKTKHNLDNLKTKINTSKLSDNLNESSELDEILLETKNKLDLLNSKLLQKNNINTDKILEEVKQALEIYKDTDADKDSKNESSLIGSNEISDRKINKTQENNLFSNISSIFE